MNCRSFSVRQFSIALTIALTIMLGGAIAGPAFAIQDSEKTTANENAPTASDNPTTPPIVDEDDPLSEDDPLKEILEGHSLHGDAFNEGPRQAAYLMGGTGHVNFPITTHSPDAQTFFNQGIGQLHGFWFLEAERSFRHAASLDPDCAMAYWGAATAAYSQRKRAQGFIAKAVELKADATDRERMYIEASEAYFSDSKKTDKKKRAQKLLKALESIVIKYPDDIEAKAFTAHRIWQNAREGIPVSSYVATNSLINEVLDAEPLHPAQHYMIHLWDNRHPENAVRAAARCGPAAPSIAHMWHMPGHIYSRLHRYEDAVYQQEASARVDHAHMMRDRVMPDEINNFAHNNEWLIRNLVFIGRVHDALDLSKNMTSLPCHPRYNTLKKRSGSASYGRRRLLQVLREYQLYEQAVELAQSHYLQRPDLLEEQIKTDRLLACAALLTNREAIANEIKQQLDRLLETKKSEQVTLNEKIADLTPDKKTSDKKTPNKETPDNEAPQTDADIDDPTNDKIAKAKKADAEQAKTELKTAKSNEAETKQRIRQIEKTLLAIEGYRAVAAQDFKTAHEKLKEATGEDVSWLGELQFLAGDTDEGIETVKKQIKRRPQEVIPVARLAFLYSQNGDQDLAQETFQQLRDVSASMDLDVELFARLQPLADEAGITGDWRKKLAPSIDLGFRPPLDSLGPFRWSRSDAPQWSLKDSEEKTVGSIDFKGQPHLVIFYLGHGCLHCAEQLQAFAPRVSDFESAGIKMIAISSDDHDGLLKSIEDANDYMPIQLASDESKTIFKRFRAFDDFEDQPLHGTFLIDKNGQICWQDIGYQPFMDHEFLLKESKRLLKENEATTPKTANTSSPTLPESDSTSPPASYN